MAHDKKTSGFFDRASRNRVDSMGLYVAVGRMALGAGITPQQGIALADAISAIENPELRETLANNFVAALGEAETRRYMHRSVVPEFLRN